jgi:CRISPR-associated protein Csx3
VALRYPAVFLGGPPNSGKSWLVRHLSLQLRRHGVMHYVLRAHPDGEGAWRYEAPPAVADELRRLAKQRWSPAFADAICRDIERRHLPLLVDTGGQASPETQQVMARCTEAILLSHTPDLLDPWRALVAAQALPLLADLHSIRAGPHGLTDKGPTLRGTVAGLGPGQAPTGPALDLLVERLDALCRFEPAVLRRRHSLLTELDVIDLEGPIGSLPAHSLPDQPWAPAEIPALLREVAPGAPIALYGVAPSWLYGALAVHTLPAPIELFQIALGWVAPPPLLLTDRAERDRLDVQIRPLAPKLLQLQIGVLGSYLDYEATLATPLAFPAVAADSAVVLDGKLPLWLYAALCRAYAGAPWLAIREPRGDEPRAIVIASRSPDRPVGTTVQLPAPADLAKD